MNIEKNWTDDVRDRLSRYESSDVPQGLWHDIESALESQPKRRFIPWMRVVSGVAAAAVVAICMVMLLQFDAQQDPMVQSAVVKPEQTVIDKISNKLIAGNKQAVAIVDKAVAKAALTSAVKQGYVPGVAVKDINEPDVVVEDAPAPVAPGNEDKSSHTAATREEPSERNNRLLADYGGTQSVISRKRSARGKVSMFMSTYAAGIGTQSPSMNGDAFLYQDAVNMVKAPSGCLMDDYLDPTEKVLYSNRYTKSDTKKNHHQPISIGVGARYFLSDRWTLETGVTYSMLESDIETGTDKSYIYDNQKIHYVGVPLSVGYQWMRNRRLSLYTNGTVAAEFGVKGKLETNYIVEGKNIDTQTSDIDNIPVQWSVGVAAGVQYNILGNLGIYAEPGLMYYIDNGSSLQTSYSDKPLNFRLKVGLRLDLNK